MSKSNKKAARLQSERRHATRGVYRPIEWAVNSALNALEKAVGRGVDAVAKALVTAWQRFR